MTRQPTAPTTSAWKRVVVDKVQNDVSEYGCGLGQVVAACEAVRAYSAKDALGEVMSPSCVEVAKCGTHSS